MTFNGYTCAVRLDTPVAVTGREAVRISIRLNPSAGDSDALSWMSVMLSTSPEARAWVTDPNLLYAFLIRSNGSFEPTTGGRTPHVEWDGSAPGSAEVYDVSFVLHTLEETSGRMPVTGRVNGIAFESYVTAEAGGQVQGRSLFLYLGAHFHPESDPRLSWIDDLRIERVQED